MKATIVVDPLYGDGGKGAAVDYLAEDADLIVRFSGGAQANHTINDGRNVYQAGLLGSGFLRGVPVFLSEHVRVDLVAILREINTIASGPLKEYHPIIYVDPKALLVTPYHVEASQNRAASSKKGTTGMGVGESIRNAAAHPESAIHAGDLGSSSTLVQKLWEQAWDYRSKFNPENIASEMLEVAKHIRLQKWDPHIGSGNIIFEGSGGYYIDPEKGFQPYVTSTRTTHINAVPMILEMGKDRKVSYEIVGVLPIFTTRHGPGPFQTEESRLIKFLLPPQETPTEGQGPVRVGWLDLDLAAAACKDMRVDKLHVSHLDMWDSIPFWKVFYQGFLREIPSRQALLDLIEETIDVPISVVAYGPKRSDRRPYERK